MRLPILMIVTVSLGLPAQSATPGDWMTLSQKGYLSYQDKKYEEALALYQASISSLDASRADELARTDLLLVVAAIHTALCHFGEADAILNQVQPTVFKKKYKNQMLQVRYLRRLRTLRVATKAFGEAAHAQSKIVEIVSLNFGPYSERALDEVACLASDQTLAGNLLESIGTAKRIDDALPLVRGKSTANRCKESLNLYFSQLASAMCNLVHQDKLREIGPVISQYDRFKSAKHERAASLITVMDKIDPRKISTVHRFLEQLARILKDSSERSEVEERAYLRALIKTSLPSLYSHNVSSSVRDTILQADLLRSRLRFVNDDDLRQFVQIRSMYCWAMAETGAVRQARKKWLELEKRFRSSDDKYLLIPIIQSGNEIAIRSKSTGETAAGLELDKFVADLKKKNRI